MLFYFGLLCYHYTKHGFEPSSQFGLKVKKIAERILKIGVAAGIRTQIFPFIVEIEKFAVRILARITLF